MTERGRELLSFYVGTGGGGRGEKLGEVLDRAGKGCEREVRERLARAGI